MIKEINPLPTVPQNHVTIHKAAMILIFLFCMSLLVAAFVAGFEAGHGVGYWDRDFELRKVKGNIVPSKKAIAPSHQAIEPYAIAGMHDEGIRRVYR